MPQDGEVVVDYRQKDLGGQILVATPIMQEPPFAGSIICVCAHSEEGAMGLVLNRPMEGLSFDDLLKQLDLEPVPAQRSIRLHQGGPQEGGRGFVLHTNDWSSEGSLQVGGDLALTASPPPQIPALSLAAAGSALTFTWPDWAGKPKHAAK